jgi:hypothetical protein
MSIAVAISVHDGVVLAADSASTLAAGFIGGLPGAGPQPVAMNVYNNANKIANLYKGKPIGCVAYGSGSIGSASISTLLKDFRYRLMTGLEKDFNPSSYTIEEIGNRLSGFLDKQTQSLGSNDPKPTLGLMLAGYSADKTPGEVKSLGEVWSIGIQNGIPAPVQNMRPKDPVGISWAGEAESLARLLMGFSPRLPQLLQVVAKPAPSPQDMEQLLGFLSTNLQAPVVFPPMPIQDTIDLAEWLVQTAIMFSRFTPGVPVVGGPIESAAITKHEGFKWIRRKHYYHRDFNLEVTNERSA